MSERVSSAVSGATLTLANYQGLVQLAIGKSSINYYDYVITGGTGRFASASDRPSETVTALPPTLVRSAPRRAQGSPA